METDNGWRKDGEIEVYGEGSGIYGDDQIGDGYAQRYAKAESEWRAEIGYYVIATPVAESDDRHGTFGVEQQIQMWRDIGDDDQTDLSIDYDYGDVRCFGTEEEANRCAKRLADMNWSYIFNV